MTLAAFAQLVDVRPKWVLNTMTALRRPRRYSADLARRLTVTRAIHQATGAPLVRGFAQAERALRAYRGGTAPVVTPTDNDEVGLVVDIRRILSSFNARLSVLETSFAPRKRGRPPARRRTPLKTASEWGIDLTLLADNLDKTAEQRLRQLDAMVAFARGVRRLSPSAR